MSSDNFSKIETCVPNYCPHFETEIGEINRQRKKYNISIEDLHEALEGSISESFLAKVLEKKVPRIKTCVVIRIREAINEIITYKWLGKIINN